MEKVEILAEHYQKTYELTMEMWKQRNRVFLILVGLIMVAALLTLPAIAEGTTKPLVVHWVASAVNMKEEERAGFREHFPFEWLQFGLMVGIFYLMMNLFHRAHNVLFYYNYLGQLEAEIRGHLRLPSRSVFFTREGGAYWRDRKKDMFRGLGLNAVKYVYLVLIAGLLVVFYYQKVLPDLWPAPKALGWAELALAAATLFYFCQYVYSSLTLEGKDEAKLPTPFRWPTGSVTPTPGR